MEVVKARRKGQHEFCVPAPRVHGIAAFSLAAAIRQFAIMEIKPVNAAATFLGSGTAPGAC